MSNLFREEIIAAARSRKNVGTINNPDSQANSYNASCGDSVSVQILFSDDGSKIKDMKWQGNGCIISQASMSLLSTVIVGKPVSEAVKYTQEDVLKLLQLDSISPGRERCLMLGLSTIKQALASQSSK